MTNVGFIGKMASGKTAGATFLENTFDNYYRISFAEPIKQIVEVIDMLSAEEILSEFIWPFLTPPLSSEEENEFRNVIEETRQIEKELPKPRKRLQFFGTEGGRKRVRETIWVDILLGRMQQLNDFDQMAAIDDVRFLNEAQALESEGTTLIKLTVDEETQRNRLIDLYGFVDKNAMQHESEKYINHIQVPHTLDGTQPLEEMYQKILQIVA